MKRRPITIGMCAVALTLLSPPALAWEGYSYETGKHIDVESYDHGGRGEGEVEYYDYESGTYKRGYLDMYRGGTGTITDYETGETFDVDMD